VALALALAWHRSVPPRGDGSINVTNELPLRRFAPSDICHTSAMFVC
jgi:hypothetical protein